MKNEETFSWKESGRALHVNVADKLREQIKSETLKPGQMIGSETVLCKSFGVSRVTIRQSLSVLENEGLINTLVGKGRFVKNRLSSACDTEIIKIRVLVDSREGFTHSAWFLGVIEELGQAAVSARCQLFYEFYSFTGHDRVLDDMQGDYQGVLVIPFSHQCMDFLATRRSAFNPMVSFLRQINSGAFSQFYINQESGAFRATEFLLRYGHRRIGLVSVARSNFWPASEEREAGYLRALDAAGVEFDPRLLVRPLSTAKDIYNMTLELLNRSDRPSALLIGGSFLLKSALRAIDETKLRIPDQLSVIEFDDLPETQMHEPPLTVVKQPLRQGARQALGQLLEEIQRPGGQPVKVGLEPELVLRTSCAVAPEVR